MSFWSAFHFLRPWWLLVALPPLALALLRFLCRPGSEQWKGIIAPHLLKRLVTQPSTKPWLSPEVLLLPFSLILAAALAGPTYRLAKTPEGPDDTTLLVVVDLSSSMKGQDIGPSRIGRLRLKLRDLINLRRGARIGLIAVAGRAHVVMPPTDDADALIPYLDVLDPDLMPSDGEEFSDAAPLLAALALSAGSAHLDLQDSGKEKVAPSRKARSPVVALIAADSIPPADAQALSALRDQGISLIGWTVGTDHGVPGQGVPGLKREGFDQLTRAGARVVDLSLTNSDISDINQLLDRARTAVVDPKDASLWDDAGYPLVFLFAVGLLLWFRRGWVIQRGVITLLALLSTGCTPSDVESAWLDLWLTPDQQGRLFFEKGDYKRAAEHYTDPMWKGVAYYTAGDFEHAEEQFSRIDTIEGLFNLANAHAQKKEIVSAIAVYDQVLKRRPTHRGARKNRDYLKGVLAGLEQTSDLDTLDHPAEAPADATQAKLRKDQTQGPRDPGAEEAPQAKNEKRSLSGAENDRWMKRVTTSPADFLRAKFAIQEQSESQP